MSSTITVSCGTTCTVLGAAFLALAFGTDYWVYVFVNGSELKPPKNPNDARIFYTRYWGLWRDCFVDRVNSSWIIQSSRLETAVADKYCLQVEYEIPIKSSSLKFYSNDYWAMIHLRRAVIGLFVMSLLFLVVGAVVGAAGCWHTAARYTRLAGVLVFLATFFSSLGMGLWHGAEYLEKNGMTTDDPSYLQKNWPKDVVRWTRRRYAWSYICAWVGVGCCAIASMLYLLAAVWINRKQELKTSRGIYEGYSERSFQPLYGSAAYSAYPVDEYYYAAPSANATPYGPSLQPQKSAGSHPNTIDYVY